MRLVPAMTPYHKDWKEGEQLVWILQLKFYSLKINN